MDEMRYTISDAAKMVKVESHVLRYWEDELALEIPRNEMGHRYYTQREIDIFCQIRALKDRGLQLKAIKDVLEIMSGQKEETNIISLDNIRQNYENDEKKSAEEVEEKENKESVLAKSPVSISVESDTQRVSSEEKMRHFKYIMDNIVAQALQENNLRLEEAIVGHLLNEMDTMEQEREEKEELRFRKLDETIRGRQRGYQEVAAAKLPPYTPTKMNKRRFGLFRK